VQISKIHVIPPPFPVINDRRDHNGQNILFIGRDYVRKGGETVLDVFEKLTGFPDVRLIYVGKVEDERALQRIRTNRQITHYPRPSDSFLKAEVFPVSDIFFLPTRADAFVASIPEAMGRGIPVVASNISALPEIVEQGASGYLADQGDSDQLAMWLARLLENPERRRKMGELAQDFIKRHFSRDKLDIALMRVYESALA
jgi:glycosyltransferase involved in cell wall biosynthesis